ncbi:prefoldin subunit 4, putative [Cryptosporidium muris RN66]|uniref:Prefoldin subunit 4 n=1 Tax=Cryptosporidium muris (strain RN66) TaxID=441375 RepID=B6AHL6_CRYMR|nr:prefoldin subunit 4, putative [Cryptosporidium muris RN66]EEA07711.1 prefoldin subunit 4, putative [Cryptosporidium muris RN66]|eukprot:XP_002142060.1 prefoldin subunit 4 [Cryptosporidium muris RN66]
MGSNEIGTGIEINYEDQKQINKFSSLLYYKTALTTKYNNLKEKLQTYQDATEEVTLSMDSDKLLLKIGESFFLATEDEVMKVIEEYKDETISKVMELSDKLSNIETEMSRLKTDLYAKFGSNINLDE